MRLNIIEASTKWLEAEKKQLIFNNYDHEGGASVEKNQQLSDSEIFPVSIVQNHSGRVHFITDLNFQHIDPRTDFRLDLVGLI